ncbi:MULTISPECIES: hypothetical protein [unclassified Kribbella]|uniref:hypothetical protein n=1 Tax=unclassified Kribbella TaxID=2644121 RepID=UPI003077373C
MPRTTTAKAVATAATALVLLTACGGSDDKNTDSKPQGGGDTPASTPSAPAVASFDPPKTFVAASAFAVEGAGKDNSFTLQAGMVGQTSLLAGRFGVTGRNIAAQGDPWTVPSTAASTTETVDATAPMGVQLDGKDVVAIAYIQNDKGNGTQKAKGQVLFQWLDATDGKKVAEVTADLTPILGPGEGGENVMRQAYDAATGQIAVGVHPAHPTAKSGAIFTVFADPKTQKSTVIPSLEPAGVLNGVVAGANGGNAAGEGETTIVIADAGTGKVTKQIPTNHGSLRVAGRGVKRAYLSANTYVKPKPGTFAGTYKNALYSVDIATGTVVQTASQYVEDSVDYTCLGDQANAVVCTGADNGSKVEILGVDDSTGKKTWGYTKDSASRIIPDVTAAFHGIVYAQTEVQPVLVDAATGNDVKSASPTPSDSTTPTNGATPTSTPSDGSGSQGKDPSTTNGSDMSLYDGTMRSPRAVTQYGGSYLQGVGKPVLIALAPTS